MLDNQPLIVFNIYDFNTFVGYVNAECAAKCRNNRENHAPKRNQHEFHKSSVTTFKRRVALIGLEPRIK